MEQQSSQNVRHRSLSTEKYCTKFYSHYFGASPLFPHWISLMPHTQQVQENNNSSFIHVNIVYIQAISLYF